MRTFGVALRQHGAEHQLDLVKEHQRQDEDADAGGRKEDVGHRDAVGEAFFRAAEDDGDFVGFVEAERAGAVGGEGEDDGEQGERDHADNDQCAEADAAPDAFQHRFAEGGIDDEQDGALVGDADEAAVFGNPRRGKRAREVAEDEGQQQLQHDGADGAGEVGLPLCA